MDEGPPVADLHAHTTVSDGSFTLDTLREAAQRASVEWVAVTDHDRIHPGLGAPVVKHQLEENETPLRIIRGIELRVDAGDQRLDLLGYGVERTADLTAEVTRLQQERQDRARKILTRVEDRLDIELDMSIEDGVGRPHIARAIDASEASLDYAGAFEQLIGNDCPCYVARDIPEFERGRRLLSDACALVGLAHPLRYSHPDKALAYTEKLDAVERFYPYGRPVDNTPVEQAATEHDLLLIGGTDAHGTELGRAGLTAKRFAPLRERLPTAVPAN